MKISNKLFNNLNPLNFYKRNHKVADYFHPREDIIQFRVKMKDLDTLKMRLQSNLEFSDKAGVMLLENPVYEPFLQNVIKEKRSFWAFNHLNIPRRGFNVTYPNGTKSDDIVNYYLIHSMDAISSYFETFDGKIGKELKKMCQEHISSSLDKFHKQIDNLDCFENPREDKDFMIAENYLINHENNVFYDSRFKKFLSFFKIRVCNYRLNSKAEV